MLLSCELEDRVAGVLAVVEDTPPDSVTTLFLNTEAPRVAVARPKLLPELYSPPPNTVELALMTVLLLKRDSLRPRADGASRRSLGERRRL